MTQILIETRLKNVTVKTMFFGSTYETFALDKYGRRFKSFQVNSEKQAKQNHKKCVNQVSQ